jgi:hypothetical protein
VLNHKFQLRDKEDILNGMTENSDFSSILSKPAIPSPDQPDFSDDYKDEQDGLKPTICYLYDFYLHQAEASDNPNRTKPHGNGCKPIGLGLWHMHAQNDINWNTQIRFQDLA